MISLRAALNSLGCVDSGADDSDVLSGRNHFDLIALKWTQFDHFTEVFVQEREVEVARFEARNEEFAGTVEMDAGSGGGGQSAVPELHEFDAAGFTGFGLSEDLFRFEIHEAKANGAVAHDAFQVALAAAAAEVFFRIKRDNRVSGFPDAAIKGVATVADAGAQEPDSNEAV